MRRGAGRWLAVCLLVGTVGVFAVPQAAGVTAVTRYVVSTGDDTSNDCTDSATPCASLQYAIDQANPGDTIDVAGTLDSHVTIAESLTITQWPDQAPAVLDGTNNGVVVTISGNAGLSVTLSELTVENGTSSDVGGIANFSGAALTVDNATISNNSATGSFAAGGGIANGGTLTVKHSTFSNNSATWAGGAIADGGTMTVEDSTFSDNSTTTSSPLGGGAIIETNAATVNRSTFVGNNTVHGSGGGIALITGGPPPPTPPSLLVADSTFAGNSADVGGAIASNGSITVESSTLTDNSAALAGAAIASGNFNVLFAADIFAKPASGTNCAWADSPVGPVDAGYNVDDDGTCGLHAADHSVSNSSAIDHYLGALADNGGPTETVALLHTPNPATSEPDPALGAVSVSFSLPHAVDGETKACSVPDQRGVAPTAGTPCDVGAYQTSPPSAPGALTGRIAHNALHLSWKASKDNIGIDHYVVYFGKTPLRQVAGTKTQVMVHTFDRHGASIFTLRAFDTEGNVSEASDTVIVRPNPRPKSAPLPIPHWAWRLFAWQEHHAGARPVTPQPLPAWYGPWKKWRETRFRLVG